MKLTVLIILLLCASGLYLVKHLTSLYTDRTLYEASKRVIKKALHLAFIGTAGLGLLCFALFQLLLVNENEFSLLTSETLSFLRIMVKSSNEASAVHSILQLMWSAILFFVQISSLLSIVGSFVIKHLVSPQATGDVHADPNPAKLAAEDEAPKVRNKLFLHLAHLRI